MNEIQDIKDAFGKEEWERRVAENPRRIYAFLLASDEHTEFLKYVQRAWRTLHAVSGESCDIFTFEQPTMPDERFSAPNYFPIFSPGLGPGRIESTDRLPELEARLHREEVPDKDALGMVTWLKSYSGQQVAIDNGIRIPDRTLCFEIRDQLFEHPESIILPGVAIFASPVSRDAVYVNCGGLTSDQLSDGIQGLFNMVRLAYRESVAEDRFDVYEAVKGLRFKSEMKNRVYKAVSTLTIKDVFSILTGGIGLIIPKSGSAKS